MPRKTDHQSMTALIGAAVAADATVAARVRKLIDMQLRHAEHVMIFGSDTEKNMLMRAIVPAMMKSLQQTEESEDARRQREAVHSIYAALRGDDQHARSGSGSGTNGAHERDHGTSTEQGEGIPADRLRGVAVDVGVAEGED